MQCLRLCLTLFIALSAPFQAGHAAEQGSATPRIVGGQNAPIDRWPWMAQLAIQDPNLSGGYLLCGASHISTGWILTAAHCLQYTNGAPADASNVYVFIGDTERNNRPTDGIQAQQLLIHRQYSNLNHDLALIRIPARGNTLWPSIITPEGASALEAAPFSQRDEAMIALGWGETGNGLSNQLQQVQLDYIPRSLCRQLSGLTISDFVICAAELNPVNGRNQDSCFGDSGGPLLLDREGTAWLAGITSFGEQTCATGAPGGYTHLAAETGELEALTASAGDPLVDLALLWNLTPPARYYNRPGGSRSLALTLRNNGNNSIGDPTLSLTLTGQSVASAQWDSCTGSLLGNTCTPTGSLAGSRTQSFTVNGNNGQDQVVTIDIQGRANQEDFRRPNNTLQQVVVFSNNPDIALEARQTSQTTDRATVTVTLSNLSTLNAATGTAVEFSLPSGISLANAATLGCTDTSPTRCPMGTLAADTSKRLNLQLDSSAGISRMLNLTATLNERDVPDGDTRRSLSVNYAAVATSTFNRDGSSGGGVPMPALLLTLSLLALRRRPCSLP